MLVSHSSEAYMYPVNSHGMNLFHLAILFFLLLLCSHSHNDVPSSPYSPPQPQWNVSMAAVQGAVRPAIYVFWISYLVYHIKLWRKAGHKRLY